MISSSQLLAGLAGLAELPRLGWTGCACRLAVLPGARFLLSSVCPFPLAVRLLAGLLGTLGWLECLGLLSWPGWAGRAGQVSCVSTKTFRFTQ